MRARRLAARDERRSAVLLRAYTYRPIQRGNRVVDGRRYVASGASLYSTAHDDSREVVRHALEPAVALAVGAAHDPAATVELEVKTGHRRTRGRLEDGDADRRVRRLQARNGIVDAPRLMLVDGRPRSRAPTGSFIASSGGVWAAAASHLAFSAATSGGVAKLAKTPGSESSSPGRRRCAAPVLAQVSRRRIVRLAAVLATLLAWLPRLRSSIDSIAKAMRAAHKCSAKAVCH